MLIIDESSGEKHAFGPLPLRGDDEQSDLKGADSVPNVKVVVNSDSFWVRLLLFADIGFAESYMLGDFECNDLVSFFRVCICNILNHLRVNRPWNLSHLISRSLS